MSRKLNRILTVSVIVGGILVIMFAWWLFIPHRIYPASIFVEKGEPFYKVVRKLKDRDVVSSPWLFSKVGIIAGLDRRVVPGRYDFDRKASNFGIMRKFWRGDIAYTSLTIPEGVTLGQIGSLLHRRCGTDRQVFDSLVRDSLYLANLGIKSGFAEGYLFPETYRFEWGISAGDAITAMADQFFAHIDGAIRARADSMGYTLPDLLKMASIIEREGFFADEYPVIASVYYNRFRRGMKLQADPTVIYAMGGLDRTLTQDDYKFPSAYNTYLHKGLPPTPICSPGMTAIRAALYPDSTDYLYFVADGSGRHIFTKTYREHLAAIRDVKRGRKSN
jgi:UPF0755 protein